MILRIILLINLLASSAFATPICTPLLRETGRPEAAIATIKDLFQERILSVADILEIRELKNPFESRRDQTAEIYGVVVKSLVETVKAHKELSVMIEQFLGETRISYDRRAPTVVKTKQSFLKMRFLEIAPGEFFRGSAEDEDYHPVKITKPFKIADVPVTQWQYAMVMGVNPAHFKDGAESQVLDIPSAGNTQASRAVSMRSYYPVEQVSWENAQEFIRRLNELSDNDDPIVYQIIDNHIARKHYRLPNESEWEFVARNRGAWKGFFPDGITSKNISDHFWHCGNSKGSSHGVAEFAPLMIDNDKPIFDILGNVMEWVEDVYDHNYGLDPRTFEDGSVAVDPTGPPPQPGSNRVLRGGCWFTNALCLHIGDRVKYKPDTACKYFGFRLAVDQ